MDQEELDWDTVESKCGAGCGLNCGLLLNARLKKKSFILGNAQSSDISHHNLDVFKAKVNGWFGNDKNRMIIKINLRRNEKEVICRSSQVQKGKLLPLPMEWPFGVRQ